MEATRKTELVHTDAQQRLQVAADAIGLEVNELIALAIEAGVMPTSAPATSALTVSDIGWRMHQEMRKIPGPERAAWFATLLETQQSALIVALRDKGYRTEVIARELDLDSAFVTEIWNRYADLVGQNVVSVRLNTIAGHLQMAAERAQDGLMDKDDWKGYFGVAKDMVRLLQELGIVDRAIHKVEVTHRFDEQKQTEVDALVDLEEKKRRRMLELKDAEFTVLDTLPETEEQDA